ncbi:MAG: hypothetical protein M0Q42_04830 [Xanthomonadales bacterium]|nr:hypothetical protein [Xanthomonadales bacterium]
MACLPGLLLIAACVAMAVPSPAVASSVRLTVEQVQHEQLAAESVALSFQPAAGATPARMQLSARALSLPGLRAELADVQFQCQPERLPDADVVGTAAMPANEPSAALTRTDDSNDANNDRPPARWQCQGPLAWRGAGSGWQMVWRADEALTQAELQLIQGQASVSVKLPLAGAPVLVQVRRAGRAWLRGLLPQLDWQSAQIDGTLAWQPTGGEAGSSSRSSAASPWHGQVQARDMAVQNAAGTLATDGLALTSPVTLSLPAAGGWRLQARPVISRGELLAGPLYVEWPAGSQVALDLSVLVRNQAWTMERLTMTDTGVALSGQGSGPIGAGSWLDAFNASGGIDLAQAQPRYLDGLLAGLGQRDVALSGQIEGEVALAADGRLDALDLALADVSVGTGSGRYAITGLDGPLAFRRGAAPAPFDLRWRQLSMHALAFGPGRWQGQSSGAELRASAPVAVELFEGRLRVGDLVLRPVADSGDLLAASLSAEGVDMSDLVVAFGWPRFAGELSGQLPRLVYGGQALRVEGEIDIRAFDGRVSIGGLSVERPFGVAPALAADIGIQGLDLQPMTEVFGFGRIEGRLNGRIDGLRLLDWRPVAFDAGFRTAESGRRRISQLAVNQLTSIGGSAGIQGRLLGMFDSFGYRRIGLSCVLANQVCRMSGLDRTAGGYTILEGSGLPSITIRGFQEQVDWPVLVNRLQAALAGDGPRVE